MAARSALQTLETVKARLHERRRVLGSWEAVAAEIDVSLGTTVRVSQGYEPRTPGLRAKFGLPALKPAPVCPVHGVVHARTCRPVPAWVRQAADWLGARERVAS
jgi:hypothetical protein